MCHRYIRILYGITLLLLVGGVAGLFYKSKCEQSREFVQVPLQDYMSGINYDKFKEIYIGLGNDISNLQGHYKYNIISTMCGDHKLSEYVAYNYNNKGSRITGRMRFIFYRNALYKIVYEPSEDCMKSKYYNMQKCDHDNEYYHCTGAHENDYITNTIAYDKDKCFVKEIWSVKEINQVLIEDLWQDVIIND